jgi:hypothetical protein
MIGIVASAAVLVVGVVLVFALGGNGNNPEPHIPADYAPNNPVNRTPNVSLIIPPSSSPSSSPSSRSQVTGLTELGKELEQYRFTLEGVAYQVPMRHTVFIDNGWVLDGFEDSIVEPDGYASMFFEKGSVYITTFVHNHTEQERLATECWIDDVWISRARSVHAQTPDFSMPGGIKLGSSMEDIIQTYGEPSWESKRDGTYTTVLYAFSQGGSSFEYCVTFYGDEQGLYEVRITY